ncbi:MAG TPA: hypothetical protein VLK22_02565, partial [Candidatus Udaeobacter sp.]|nr:hypothetical protein [Candidatus Udaeobacter sp.]
MIAGCLGVDNDRNNQSSVTDNPTSSVNQDLANGNSKKLNNINLIKQRAAQKGITNFFLLALIAENETRISQCALDWSTNGCTNVGTTSECPASLGGVLGGASDAPVNGDYCINQQGGVGMFQLDKGTYAQTISGWANTSPGYDVMSTTGNIDAAIKFVIGKLGFACAETPVFDANPNDGITPTQTTYTPADEALVVQWLNGAIFGTADFQTFLSAEIVCYNGAARGSAVYNSRLSDYTNNASSLYNYFGSDFWSASASPTCQNSGPFSGSGSNGQSGTNCLAIYSFPVISGNMYRISTCDSFSGDTY